MSPPSIASDLIVGAAALARFVYGAMRDFGAGVLIAPQCRDSLDDALDEAREASIVIIGDDTDRALRPDGFHTPSMARLFERATETVISSAPLKHVHAAMSTLAALGRRFVVTIETRPEPEIAWVAFIRAANPSLPILRVTVEAGCA